MVAVLFFAACIDLTTDPDEIVAIEFSELPWPAVVAGDTLRDATGAAAPLTAKLFDADGDLVTGPVEFLVQRGGVRVVNGVYLVADDTATESVGLIASTSGIQSVVRQIEIVAAPDSLAADPVTPFEWVVPDDPSLNTSQPLSARVLSAAVEGVRAWVVTFELEVEGLVVPPTDTSQIYLVADNGRVSYVDTTDAFGRASRRLRLKVPPGSSPPDSAVITLRASYLGLPLKGSPVRLVLPMSPG
jgi:hypothetical protein